ncbi:MAG TPA: helicase HerA-like domain-containing protein [Gemmatimonadales bacterium]|nr:helicase HerA-like domain-containing protein [Gemmatimonadales bacterium]
MANTFTDTLAAYGFTEPALVLGAALEGGSGTVHREPKVRIPLATMNRHGLIAGATGTGKTKTLQLLTEQLSAAGVPVFVADVKGDLSGLAATGTPDDRVAARAGDIGWTWTPTAYPVEFVSLTGKLGIQLRATVSSFGPLLLGKVLSLNDTQTSVLTMVFRYADDQQLPLLDLADLRAVLQWLASDEGKHALAGYGGMSSATVGVLLRKMIELESQGAERFFGEPEFDVRDMLRTTSDGRGVVTSLELADVQDKPMLWSTFMMWLLAELYQNLPEAGDLPKPKLVFFFDEAHLLFDEAPKAFRDQIEQVIRLIRSKGIGVYMVTQTPKDVPTDVLAQLGNRVQHALRAHTPDDDKALKATVRTFPKTPFYDLEETLTSLGIGEAVVTVLDTRGTPTPVVATRLIPPASRMAPLTPEELQADIARSDLLDDYATAVDRESARELLAARMAKTEAPPARAEQPTAAPEPKPRKSAAGTVAKAAGATMIGALSGTIGRTIGREVIRGIFGLLGAKPPRSTTRRTSRW